MTFVVIAHFRAGAGTEQQVADSLRRMIEPSRAEPGNLAYAVHRSRTNPAEFMIYEEYVDEEAFAAHASSDHFARFLKEGTLPYLEMRQRHDLVPLAPAGAGRSEALVATDRPARYGKQLVAHLGRRNGGEWFDGDQRGYITLGTGRAELSCEPAGLRISVEGDADNLARLEDVVGRHLVRFGTRDELHVRWSRSDGTPGTEQHATED
jgi:quinol monooxygenase YgiN